MVIDCQLLWPNDHGSCAAIHRKVPRRPRINDLLLLEIGYVWFRRCAAMDQEGMFSIRRI